MLDDYVEAQIHGTIRLESDVAAMVLDPCFKGTEVESAAQKLPCPIEWHNGFRLSVSDLKKYPDYRGQEFVDLGCEIAADGYLDPLIIGNAVKSGNYDAQSLKKVWHYTARYGDLSVGYQ